MAVDDTSRISYAGVIGMSATHSSETLISGVYTIGELCTLLQCSRRHVYRNRDTIPGAVQCGRLLRWSRATVDAWLEGGNKLADRQGVHSAK